MWAKISLGIVLLLVAGAILWGTSSGLIHKAITKFQHPDIYQLDAHYADEKRVRANLESAPTSPKAWLDAARFEIADNSPYGAEFCLQQATANGASSALVQALRPEIGAVKSRWDGLCDRLLSNGRFADGNNVYADIYPLLDQVRNAKGSAPLTGKARADYDLLEAHLLLREGRRDEARAILAGLKDQKWPLAGLTSYLYAKSYLRESDPALARAAFTDYLNRFPGERLNAYAQLELGNLALKAFDKKGAEAAYEVVTKRHPDTPQAHAAMLALLDLAMGVVPEPPAASSPAEQDQQAIFNLASSDPEPGPDVPKGDQSAAASPLPPETTQAARPVPAPTNKLDPRLIPHELAPWDLYGALFEQACEAPEVQTRAVALWDATCGATIPPPDAWVVLSPEDAYGWAKALAASGHARAAIKLCDWGIGKQGAKAPTRVHLAQLRGRLQILLGSYADAESGLTQVRNELATQTEIAPLDYEIARSYRMRYNPGKARAWYQKASTSHDPELALDARAQAAWAASQMGKWDVALSEYQGIVASNPDSAYADVGREHLLSQAIREHQDATAAALAADLKAHATSGARALKGAYFLRRPKGGDWSAFFKQYPFTIYGTYAAQAAKEQYRGLDLASLPSALTFDELRKQETSIAGAEMEAVLWDLADAEWSAKPAKASIADPFRLMGEALLEAVSGHPKQTILKSAEFFDRGGQAQVPYGWASLLLDEAYPLKYLDQVDAAAAKVNFPPSIVLGIIRQESFFNPKATSGAGARGLMQLMPATAKWAAKQAGLSPPDAAALEDPATNLALGCWNLQFLRSTVGESFGLVLAAHNGGPGNVAKWQSTLADAGSDPALFLELIPNQETREFCKMVLTNQAVYEYRLGEQGQKAVF